MNCIIIDDEATARTIIAEYITYAKGFTVIAEFSNAIEAIKYLNQNEVDLIFLDIHMPDFTGFDFIQTIANPPYIILTTSDPNLAFKAFEYSCIVDYLVKPIMLDRFKKSIERTQQLISQALETKPKGNDTEIFNNELYVNIDRRLIKIDISSIYTVVAKGDYIHIKTKSTNYIVHSSLKKIQDKLPSDIFLKVHRSYIINIKNIVDIKDNSVLIHNEVIPVSRSSRPELLKRLNLL
ncbi:LytR/AlgR family response regulator transcription factor [Mariniflexile jejuense]|uniref:LytR/AlgR family response regulator transcription factor n=1 Tax=Mariniflexile jejuense TaxID=1173582 RepID=A0ABW3JEU3_9FLAO